MANCYYMNLMVTGPKKSLDEMQSILQQEIDGGQTSEDYYTIYKSLALMGFDPDKIDGKRAFTENVEREADDRLSVRYVGAWGPQEGVMHCLRQRWPDLTIVWDGIDEFGEGPLTNDPTLVGKWQIYDEEEGVNPFCELDEWVGDEALPVINEYYHTDCKTMQEAFDTIENLNHSEQMQFYIL